MSNNELVLPAANIPIEVQQYGQELSGFTYMKKFPDMLLQEPDHVMIKAPIPSFSDRVKEIQTWVAERPIFAEVDWRFVVAGHLAIPISFMEWRSVQRLEVMESKTPEGTGDYIGVEYASFYFGDFSKARSILEKEKITFEQKHDGNSRWLNVPINEAGQEFRVTDKRLEQTLEEGLESGNARYLEPRPWS